MRRTMLKFAAPIAGDSAMLAAPAAADDLPGIAPAPSSISQISAVVRSPAAARKNRSFDTEWDGSSLHLAVDRVRIGNKHQDPSAATLGPWTRQVALKARYEYELADDLSLSITGRAQYAKSGTIEGPLLTQRSAALSREFGVSLSSPLAYFTLSQFRSGGWEVAALEEVANRMANGEKAARDGMALEAGIGDGGEPRLALRLEMARAGDWARDNRAMISWSANY